MLSNMLSRKQRQIQARGELILSIARRMLLDRGYVGMTMDRIAHAAGCSKGTVYQHFSNKEDILAELTLQTARKRASYFERAATFQGLPRERVAAIGIASELFIQRYPDHVHSERVLMTASLWDKASPSRQEAFHAILHRKLSIVSGIIRDAISRGELTLPPNFSPEELSFGLWSANFGGQSLIMAPDVPLEGIGIAEPYRAIWLTCTYFLDGLGWRPLSSEWDYSAVRQRILNEVFPNETGAS